MHERDAFFTQTIVGGPFTAFLGSRILPHREGLHIDLSTGADRLSEGWRDWVELGRSLDAGGLPRRWPGPLTRWLERHALVLAVLGLAALVLGGVLFGLSFWR